jgi:hypothetical protein
MIRNILFADSFLIYRQSDDIQVSNVGKIFIFKRREVRGKRETKQIMGIAVHNLNY